MPASAREAEPVRDASEPAARVGPATTSALVAQVLSLQRSAGNAAVARAIRAGGLRAPAPTRVLGRRLLQRYDFTTQRYDLSNTPVPIVKESSKGKKAEIAEAPADYCSAILRDAGLSPDTWFSNFTAITFLGLPVGDPIHVDLATHLKDVEKQFVADYGGDAKTPAAAGKALGVTSVGGSRRSPTSAALSMHLFGLAIDVNYTANPFISDSANPVFARAGKLLGEKNVAWTGGMKFEQLARLDNLLEAYFSMIDSDQLEHYLKDNPDAPWNGLGVEAARKQIQQDLDLVAGKWERSGAAQKAVIKAGGFMNLDRRFVDGIGLDWGASYGDIMHFDMRNKGNGAKIQGAVGGYKVKKDAEAKEKWAKAHPS